MVEWLACSLSKQKNGGSIFWFVLFAKHLLSHKSVKCVSYQSNFELICLFALRFSVPVNNFMSCGAEQPHPGYKAILWEDNMAYNDTNWNVNRTQDLSIRSPMFYYLLIALSCKIQLSCLGRVRQYMYVYVSASHTYTQGNLIHITENISLKT